MKISMSGDGVMSCLKVGSDTDTFAVSSVKGNFELNKNGHEISYDDLILDNPNLPGDAKNYFINNTIKNYIDTNNVSDLVSSLRLIIGLLKKDKNFNVDESMVFLKDIFINYKYFVNNEKNIGHISSIKFFISNIVPEFIEDIREKYNNSDIIEFANFLLSYVDNISFQSKIVDGLLNYKSKNSNKDFATDILENFDFTKISIKDVARLYAIISRQNANKNAIKIIDKINHDYISKLNDSDLNKFSKYFCKNVNDINYFDEKSNINIANYSQTMINYFEYVSINGSFSSFNYLVKSIKENIKDVDFGNYKLTDTLEMSLVEQSVKSMKNSNQKKNFIRFFKRKSKSYLKNIVSNIVDSVFNDGLNNKKSGKFLIRDNAKIFNKTITDKIKHNKFSDDRKCKILINNKKNLYKLSKIKSFKKEFLDKKNIIHFLKNKNIDCEDKKFLLNFYIKRILFDKKSLSKNIILSFFQRKIKEIAVKKFNTLIINEGILKDNPNLIKITKERKAPKSYVKIELSENLKKIPNISCSIIKSR